MCSACGGSVCAGTGVCTVAARYSFTLAHAIFLFFSIAFPAQVYLFYRKCKQWFGKHTD